jgi:hypothetical protein
MGNICGGDLGDQGTEAVPLSEVTGTKDKSHKQGEPKQKSDKPFGVPAEPKTVGDAKREEPKKQKDLKKLDEKEKIAIPQDVKKPGKFTI